MTQTCLICVSTAFISASELLTVQLTQRTLCLSKSQLSCKCVSKPFNLFYCYLMPNQFSLALQVFVENLYIKFFSCNGSFSSSPATIARALQFYVGLMEQFSISHSQIYTREVFSPIAVCVCVYVCHTLSEMHTLLYALSMCSRSNMCVHGHVNKHHSLYCVPRHLGPCGSQPPQARLP